MNKDSAENPQKQTASEYELTVDKFLRAVTAAEHSDSSVIIKRNTMEALKQLGALVGGMTITIEGLVQSNTELRDRVTTLEKELFGPKEEFSLSLVPPLD